MKNFILSIATAMTLPLMAQTNVTDEPAFHSDDGKTVIKIIDPELRALIKNTITEWNAGKINSVDIARYVKGFDGLLAKHKGEKTEAVAQILYAKENFYFDVLGDADTGAQLLHQLAKDYPDTELGRGIGKILKESAASSPAQKPPQP